MVDELRTSGSVVGHKLTVSSVVALLIMAVAFSGCGDDGGPQDPGGGGANGSWSGVPDSVRVATLLKYAPKVYLAADGLDGGGSYRPSSVEWFMQYVDRVPVDGKYWVQTKVPLSYATEVQDFFYGPADSDLDQVPVYAFWIEDPDRFRDYVDLAYYFFYPYNRGKTMLESVWGNHVGDWEHITVRIGVQSLEPRRVALSAHEGGEAVPWSEMQKTQDGHPIVYSAWGSHANYSTPGDHLYRTIPVFPLPDIELIDRTSDAADGVAWDTWLKLEPFDFYERRGLSNVPWPGWMSSDFENPSSGAIFRWGNTEDTCGFCIGSTCWDFVEVCLLENGPTGPILKAPVWDVDVFE
jgi:hypothetical protein